MEVRDELKDLMETRGISLTAVGRAIGHSNATMSLWYSGKYDGNKKNVERAIKAFLIRFKERLKNKAELPQTLDFVETSVSRKIFEIARVCHIENELGICYGAAGVGKTVSIKEYADENMDVVLIEVDPSYSTKALFVDVHRKLKMGGDGSLRQIVEDIVSKLKGSGRLLVIDEAEYLQYRALEQLRRVYDKSGCGVLLVGMPRLYHVISQEKGLHPQISSRIGIVAALEGLRSEDTEKIVSSLLPSANGLWKMYHEVSVGNTRSLFKLIARSRRIVGDGEVTAEAVRKAQRMLVI